jgi:transposase
MRLLFGITLNRSTSCRSILRTAAKCQPADAEIEARVRGSPVIKGDETGWKLGGVLHWLHVVVSADAVLDRIDRRRGHQVLAERIGLDYAGTLIHDGLASDDRFWRANHQQCLAHLLKRCRELLETATAGAVRFPRAVKELLQRSLSVRDRFLRGELTAAGLSSLRGRLSAALKRLVTPVKRHAGNERLAACLEQHRDEVFRFLTAPAHIAATNNESEFELRFNVVARKLSGGNRTLAGSTAQMTLPSITRTCRKLGREPYEFLRHTLCSTTRVLLYPAAGR